MTEIQEKAIDEWHLFHQKLGGFNVILFLKDGKVAAYLTMRKTPKADYVAVVFYANDKCKNAIHGYKRTTSKHFNRANDSFLEIIKENKDALSQAYGLNLENPSWYFMFKEAGFEVVWAL